MQRNIETYYRLWFDTNRVYEDWAKLRGLSVNSLFLLHEVQRAGGCTQKDLCSELFLPKQTVSGIVKQFVENGILEQKSGERDGREKIVTLTQGGVGPVSKILDELFHAETEAFGKLGSEDVKTLLTLWERLSEILKKSLERRN